MPNISSTKKGFSLLELMMVITILAVMTGILVPNMGSMMEATALERNSRLIADLLRYARSAAIQSSSTTKVVFNLSANNTTTALARRNTQNTTTVQTDPIQYLIEQAPLQQPGVFIERRPPVTIPKELGNSVTVQQVILQSMGGMQQNGSQAQQTQMNLQSGLENESQREIVFQPDGSTSDTFIHLSNGRQTHTIGIVGLTGQIMRWEEMVQSFYVE